MNRIAFLDRPVMTRRDSLLALAGAAAYLGLARTPICVAARASSAIDWNQISKQFRLDPELTYLNTGSLGCTPTVVLEGRRLIEQRLEANPVGEGFGFLLAQAEAVSAKVADLLGCDVKEVTVTRNTTEGINFIAEGIDLQPGQHVLTSNQEHGGGVGAWKYLQKTRGVVLDVADIGAPPKDEDEILASFAAKITPQTRVISCSDVLFSSGVAVPIAQLSELAHRRGCLMVVDGAQSCGGVPVNVKQSGCDAYASSGHKFLLGPKGTGVLYISEKARDQIRPMQLDDGMGYYTLIRGTNSMPEAIGLGGAIDWAKQIGREEIFARLMELRNSLYGVLIESPYVRINSPPPGSFLASHLVCFSVTDRDRHARLKQQFANDRIVVKEMAILQIDFRLSVHLYNTEGGIQRFAKSLQTAMA